MLQFNTNHIFIGYLKQFLSSFNLPTCRIYTAEFEKYFSEHGYEDPRVIESNAPIVIGRNVKSAADITYLKEGSVQQYFWDTSSWNFSDSSANNAVRKYWKSNKTILYNGNKILGLTKTLKNPTTLYNYQTHEYLGDYLRFLRDYENINLMSMYNCFSNRVCNNINISLDLTKPASASRITGVEEEPKVKTVINSYDTNYKIYMLPVKLFENYTIAIDCYQGVEMFCGFYNKTLDTSAKAEYLMKQTYVREPKTLFNQPFIYSKLDKENWSWANDKSIIADTNHSDKLLRTELAARESELKLFIKVPATNKSSIVVLAGDYRNFNDVLYAFNSKEGWKYLSNSTVANFETDKTYRYSTLPDLNSREFKPISRLQLLALNTGISYPFADRLIEYLVANVILPNDPTPDNIKRLQKVMEDCGYSFQIGGIWEPKMQMILYDYLMNSGKFAIATEKDGADNIIYKVKKDKAGKIIYDKAGNPVYLVENQRKGNLKQMGQKMRSEFYDILGYGDKDAEKLYASWKVENVEKNGRTKQQVVAKTTLENVDIYEDASGKKLYNN